MNIRDIYLKAVETGKSIDWRGEAAVEEVLAIARGQSDIPGFDSERLFNPYGDTRIVVGNPETEVTAVLVGIEIHPVHVLQAAVMRQMGVRVDLAISHHMSCINLGFYNFDDILDFHKYSLKEVGVPAGQYEPAIEEWKSAVRDARAWKMDGINLARNLDIPLMSIHTPCDLFHVKNVRDTFAAMRDEPLGAMAESLSEETESVRTAPLERFCVIGDAESVPRKVYISIGAGWSVPINVFKLACEAGIDTAVLTNPAADKLKMAAERGINILSVPHDSNDNHGINMMLDALQEMGPLTVYDAHNFVRTRGRG